MIGGLPCSVKGSFICGTVLAALCAFNNSPAIAEELNERVKINYGLMLDGEEPFAGSADCFIGERCQIVETPDLSVSLTINIGADNGPHAAIIDCSPQPCSFANGKTKSTVKRKHQLDLYDGAEGIEVMLVSKPRKHLGRISLNFYREPPTYQSP